MGIPVALTGDTGVGVCFCHTPTPLPYTTTFIGSGIADNNGLALIRVGDVGVSTCGHPTIALTGSSIVDVTGLGVHRIGDTGTNCGPYTCVTGSPVIDSL